MQCFSKARSKFSKQFDEYKAAERKYSKKSLKTIRKKKKNNIRKGRKLSSSYSAVKSIFS